MKLALLLLCLFSAMSASAIDRDISADKLQTALAVRQAAYTGNLDVEEERTPMPEIRGDRAPVWASFVSNFRKCAPGCVPADYETFGTRGKASCHNTGRAIDLGAIVCNGRTYEAIDGGRFTEFVGCMKSKMKTLYHNGRDVTRGHHDHVHFSIGCVLAGGRNYY